MVDHRIEEEESELSPKRGRSGADLHRLGIKMQKRKQALESKIPNDAGDRTMQLH